MGFDLENHKVKAEEQLSLFEFQLPTADFIPVTRLEMAHVEPVQNQTPRFVTLSAALHAASLFAVALMSVPLVEQVQTETITIETIEIEKPKPLLVSTPQTQRPSLATAPPQGILEGVPMTIDDIEAPDLDQEEWAAAVVATPLSEDFGDDFEKVDRRQQQQIAREQQGLSKMAAAFSAEQDDSLKSLLELNQKDSAQLAAMQEDLRRRNAQGIASALAAERAAAGAAKRAAAQRAGAPNGVVRSLDQLRQMPNNPRPQYDREERRRGDQGKVTFVAYINKEGVPSQFRLLKSTGFRSLDDKALTALKKWRFYPGQEGWVELPFRWDLKGGAQQDGGTLRRGAGL